MVYPKIKRCSYCCAQISKVALIIIPRRRLLVYMLVYPTNVQWPQSMWQNSERGFVSAYQNICYWPLLMHPSIKNGAFYHD